MSEVDGCQVVLVTALLYIYQLSVVVYVKIDDHYDTDDNNMPYSKTCSNTSLLLLSFGNGGFQFQRNTIALTKRIGCVSGCLCITHLCRKRRYFVSIDVVDSIGGFSFWYCCWLLANSEVNSIAQITGNYC